MLTSSRFHSRLACQRVQYIFQTTKLQNNCNVQTSQKLRMLVRSPIPPNNTKAPTTAGMFAAVIVGILNTKTIPNAGRINASQRKVRSTRKRLSWRKAGMMKRSPTAPGREKVAWLVIRLRSNG